MILTTETVIGHARTNAVSLHACIHLQLSTRPVQCPTTTQTVQRQVDEPYPQSLSLHRCLVTGIHRCSPQRAGELGSESCIVLRIPSLLRTEPPKAHPPLPSHLAFPRQCKSATCLRAPLWHVPETSHVRNDSSGRHLSKSLYCCG